MAEKVLFNIAGGIISSVVGPLAAEEFRLSWGVKKELEKLKNTASTIKAVLLDAEEQLAKSHAICDWLGKLNDILYKADDFLDAVSTDALQQELMARDKMAKKVSRFFSKPIQIVYDVRMAHKIKAIRGSLDALAADMEKFQFVVRHVEIPVRFVGRDSTYSFVREEDVIERDNDKEAIIGSLLDTNIKEKVSILPIVGIGGLGKTTLAQLVFNDNRIHNNFEQKMWVCVSDNFDIKVIIEKILESVTNRQQEDVEIEILINYLRTKIEEKRYFLVLDDVWNENLEKWLKLKSLLMVGASGSRILITTRGTNVAKITHTIDPYFLKGLEENASWNLFKSMAFVNCQEPKNSKMTKIGKEILKKCAGVPLAVRTIGRLLNSKDTEVEWIAFRDIDLAKIPQIEDTDILPVLKLSYDKLPSCLKHCFAYCSLFPKNYEFNVSMLISHWIAHGFIESLGEKQCWEDVGREYFKYLLWRLFFQEVRTDEWGNIQYCKMHDLMHDLAMLVAGSLITIFDDKNGDICEKTQHISLGSRVNFSQGNLILLSKASTMRTLIGLGSDIDLDFKAIFSCFKFLRILSMKNEKINCVLNSIERLKHLRYLHIDENYDIVKVPNSVTKLINLQTLKLTGCPRLKELPKDIKKLVNLRHLDICHGIFIPRGLGELTRLQTLLKLSVDSVSRGNARLNELIELNNLRGHLDIFYKVGVKGVAQENKGAKFLKDKLHLNSLLLDWYDTTRDFYSLTSDENVTDNDFDMEELLECLEPHSNLKKLLLSSCSSVRLPSWLSLLTNLTKLELDNCNKWQYLLPLSQFPSLKDLQVSRMNAVQYMFDAGNDLSSSSMPISFFPSLERFDLSGCPNLKAWWRNSYEVHAGCHISIELTTVRTILEHRLLHSFPCLLELKIIHCSQLIFVRESRLKNLTSLVIRQCNELKFLSRGMEYLTALVSLDLSDCPMLELGNDKDEIQWQGLKSLLNLSFEALPKLIALPTGLQYVTTLQVLDIKNCKNLMAIPKWIQNFGSLSKLQITRCSNLKLTSVVISQCGELKFLSRGMQHLTALVSLDISHCPVLELGSDKDGIQWQSLKSLLNLFFEALPKLISLPTGLQYVTTLQVLDIKNCENLTAIPEWIQNFGSLSKLQITRCSSLTSLPEGISKLSSLRSLFIWGCPMLVKRCSRGIGEDWRKIAHIPYRTIA